MELRAIQLDNHPALTKIAVEVLGNQGITVLRSSGDYAEAVELANEHSRLLNFTEC